MYTCSQNISTHHLHSINRSIELVSLNSGTTGNPKAVMLTHDNIIFAATVVTRHLPFIGAKKEQERILSYLPLSHAAGTLLDIVTAIVVSATKPGYFTVYFARPYDLKKGTMKDRLQCVRPTMFLGVVSQIELSAFVFLL
jgi:long-chain-fatty-acid--CoA ligase ACSBG